MEEILAEKRRIKKWARHAFLGATYLGTTSGVLASVAAAVLDKEVRKMSRREFLTGAIVATAVSTTAMGLLNWAVFPSEAYNKELWAQTAEADEANTERARQIFQLKYG